MNTAQPALLYLCPFLIISSLITALIRKEFKIFWSGDPIKELTQENDNVNTDESSKKKLTNESEVVESTENEDETKP